MPVDSKMIKNIYNGPVASHYDMSMSHIFDRWKRLAFRESSLSEGDNVLVFCCGTGADFPHILNKIGKQGRILGVDFSPVMLKKANARIYRNGWDNIDLVEADVTELELQDRQYDSGVCTLGLSVIPDYRKAYNNLKSAVKSDGEIIIGDMQLASGSKSRFNPLTLSLARRYGGTTEGHMNTMKIFSSMESELNDVKSGEFFLGSYGYCIATLIGDSGD